MKFELEKSFVEKYSKQRVNFGFNGLGELTYYRTYSRLKDNGENEKWFETVERVVNGIYSIQKKHIHEQDLGWNENKAQVSAQEMYERMFNFKFLPPGRGLWACGTSIVDKGLGAAMNNCFSGDTEFVTSLGIKKLADCVGQEVMVLNSNKDFVKGTVSSFGEQELYNVTLRPFGLRSNLQLEYRVTENHRWILSDGSVTTKLRVGDKVLSNPYINTDISSKEYRTGFAHGLIFGNGTRHTYYPERHIIQVCDGREKYYEVMFKDLDGYVSRTDGGKYPTLTIVRKGENWKSLPEQKSPVYLAGFIEGWLSADSHTKGAGTCLDTQNSEAAQWLIDNAVYAGYSATGISIENSDTNFGKRKSPLNRVRLVKNQVTYIVDYITSISNEEEVFCVTEPKTGSFTLAGGILTGNCGFVSTKDIHKDFAKPFCFMMDMSMLGVGIGFDVKGEGKVRITKPIPTSESIMFTYTIPDTREGWVESLRLLLDSYILDPGESESFEIQFDYSQIRKAGEPIKTFGGISSGPDPLVKLHKQLKAILDKRIDRTLSATDIADIMNLIGVCVVSGNVRRSAQIMFGEADNKEYLDLKNYKVNPERMEYGWTSNNSVFCNETTDYAEASERTAINGEPGYFWLENAQQYGRMCEAPNDKDSKVVGCNPCAEQSLENYELCCLVETFPNNHENLADYLRTLKFAYLYGKSVTLLKTHNKDTNKVLLRNRRIGLSQTGIAQFLETHNLEEYRVWCDTGYKTVQKYDEIYSNWLCIPKSVKTTSIKPSGTISLLAGATPGMHYPEDNFYIRRVRIAKTSELLKACKTAGYKVVDDVVDSSSVVVEIPVQVNCRTVNEVSIWEQVELASFIQKWWADNQVSCTVTFKPEEAKEILPILKYHQYDLKAISFLPKVEAGAYRQMPYESISEERYKSLIKGIKPLEITNMHQDSKPELYCDSTKCEVK